MLGSGDAAALLRRLETLLFLANPATASGTVREAGWDARALTLKLFRALARRNLGRRPGRGGGRHVDAVYERYRARLEVSSAFGEIGGGRPSARHPGQLARLVSATRSCSW